MGEPFTVYPALRSSPFPFPETLDIYDPENIGMIAADHNICSPDDRAASYPDAVAGALDLYFGILEADRKERNAHWREFEKIHCDRTADFSIVQWIIYKLTPDRGLN